MTEERFGQERDIVPWGRVLLVAGVAMVVFVIGVAASWWEMHTIQRPIAPSPTTEIGKTEIGLVNQPPFDVNSTLRDDQRNKRAQLESYGWIDRAHGVIHIPIDRAIDEELAAAGAGDRP